MRKQRCKKIPLAVRESYAKVGPDKGDPLSGTLPLGSQKNPVNCFIFKSTLLDFTDLSKSR